MKTTFTSRKSRLIGALLVVVASLLLIAQYASATNGLVAYWKFDESSGATAADFSGNGNTGTHNGNVDISSTAPPTSCFVNPKSLYFNGGAANTDFVGIPDDATMNPTSTISLAFWVRADDTTRGNYQHLLFKQGPSATSYGVWIKDTGELYVETNDNGGPVESLSGNTVLADNQWYYVTVTFDGTNQIIYLDGVQDAAQTIAISGIAYDSNNPLKIGGGDYNLSLLGYIDDVRFYDRALSLSEVQDLAAGGCGPGQAAEDADNIDTATEEAGPNGGDGNGDGTSDAEQSNVASLPNTVLGESKYLTLVSGGGACNTITNISQKSEQTVGDDKGNEYPLGLTDFSLTCDNPGDTATITIFYDKTYDTTGWSARKFIGGTYSSVTGATFGTATVGSNTVTTLTYSVTDGGTLDADGTANGTIVDPVGPGVAAQESLAETGIDARLISYGAVISMLTGFLLLVKKSQPNNRLNNPIN